MIGRLLISAAALFIAGVAAAQVVQPPPPLVGRWDLTATLPDGVERASWIEVEQSGYRTLVGRYVATGGSARPVSLLHYTDGRFRFTVPTQWELPPGEVRVEGTLRNERLTGTITGSDGARSSFTGVRAPDLSRPEPAWAAPVKLFNGRNLDGWRRRWPGKAQGWVVEDGLLRNRRPVNDLVSEKRFGDFKLHARFRYPKGSNSGIYLRGRYEMQIQDDFGRPPDSHGIGGIYGFLKPRINAARPAGEWQTVDLTLVGRFLTARLNGRELMHKAEIPGVTGGALNSREAEPGPIFLQGDHGPIDFSDIVITPARK